MSVCLFICLCVCVRSILAAISGEEAVNSVKKNRLSAAAILDTFRGVDSLVHCQTDRDWIEKRTRGSSQQTDGRTPTLDYIFSQHVQHKRAFLAS